MAAPFSRLLPTAPKSVPLKADFFTRFGLFVEREFLSVSECARLQAEIHTASGAPATVAEEREGDTVDDAYRRTKQAKVSDDTVARISGQLLAAAPALATHFGRDLAGVQPPQFLLYREGDFFRPHPDSSDKPGSADYVKQRSVSAVVFVNGTGAEDGGYTGGALEFYGLIDDRTSGESVGIPLDGEPGLLVAFPAELVHAVQRVTSGERYTVVSWFY